MAGNPILGFLDTSTTPTGARGNVTKMLRLLGIAILVGAAISILGTILSISMGTSYVAAATAMTTSTAIVAALFSLAVTAAACFWITFTTNAWNRNEPRGATHALVIGILATIFGGLGVLGGLMGGLVVGSVIFGAGNTVAFIVVNLLSTVMSAVECYAGAMILVNRSKAGTETGAPTTA